ncbi:IS66 family insertion sequence element accessory protein TnpB [Peribacillus butanolivorans]|uniref:IS66 family insertion sequence element accessory protein TnpB n=1 Tax=Peribacillus butanolivorans TaxID=421767 RepID=UPI0035D7CD16
MSRYTNGHEGVGKSLKYDYTSVKNIYIICGKTDMRKGIDGLATLIQDSFELDPYSDSIFLLSKCEARSRSKCESKRGSRALGASGRYWCYGRYSFLILCTYRITNQSLQLR